MASNKDDMSDVAGAAGVAVGTLGAAHLMYREKSLDRKIDAAEKRVTDAHTALETKISESERPAILNPKIQDRKTAFTKAKISYSEAQRKYSAALATSDAVDWPYELSQVKSERQVNIQLTAHEEGLKYLKSTPPSEGRDWAVKTAEAEVDALKTFAKTPGLASMSGKDASAGMSEALRVAREKQPKPPADFEAFFARHQNAHVQTMHETYAYAEPKAAKRVHEHLKKPVKELNRAADTLENTESKWKASFKKVTKEETKEVRQAEKQFSNLSKLESKTAKEGVYNALKRPVQILRHGSNKARLAIIASGAALGAIAYGVTKAISSVPDRQSESFVDRIQSGDSGLPGMARS